MSHRGKKRILIAGIGNIFKGDDAFGVEVARSLASRPCQHDAEVIDAGIRGIDLAYKILDGGYELIVFIDIVQRGDVPGTVYLIHPDLSDDSFSSVSLGADPHSMHPANVIAWVKRLGGSLSSVRVIGCEPSKIVPDSELEMGLSAPVEGAIEEAILLAEELVRQQLSVGSQEAVCMS